MHWIEFNGPANEQWLRIDKADHGLNPAGAMTVEAMLQLLESSDSPTIMSLPAQHRWTEPYVAWRLGFHADRRTPEFQITIAGDAHPTTARSAEPIALYTPVHLAGTYDGSAVRLFVNGRLQAIVHKHGPIIQSSQKPVMGNRSSTAAGGQFIGRVFEVRFWNVARTSEDIEKWKDKRLPLPTSADLVALWDVQPGLSSIQTKELSSIGFSALECALASFAMAYSDSYSRMAAETLIGGAKERFAYPIHSIIFGRTIDGYIIFYDRAPSELLAAILEDSGRAAKGGIYGFIWSQYTVSDVLQMVTGNGIKAFALTGPSTERDIVIPKNRDDILPNCINSRVVEAKLSLPKLALISSKAGRNASLSGKGRFRITSPLVALPDGERVRAYNWQFADIWRGELSWEIAERDLPDKLALNDLLALNMFAATGERHTIELPDIRRESPLLPLERIINNFESLIDRDDVDEVRDVIPFLRKQQHWLLLSPSAQHVWPEKMLGNKWRVDFIVMEADGSYTAVEVESPKKRLYRSGSTIEPRAEWLHAEQQVRDYCNFIDQNNDYVQREEGLAGIFRPSGIVVIGRRHTLTEVAKRKLAERNVDNGRYRTITSDDLVDQAKALVRRLQLIVAPGSGNGDT